MASEQQQQGNSSQQNLPDIFGTHSPSSSEARGSGSTVEDDRSRATSPASSEIASLLEDDKDKAVDVAKELPQSAPSGYDSIDCIPEEPAEDELPEIHKVSDDHGANPDRKQRVTTNGELLKAILQDEADIDSDDDNIDVIPEETEDDDDQEAVGDEYFSVEPEVSEQPHRGKQKSVEQGWSQEGEDAVEQSNYGAEADQEQQLEEEKTKDDDDNEAADQEQQLEEEQTKDDDDQEDQEPEKEPNEHQEAEEASVQSKKKMKKKAVKKAKRPLRQQQQPPPPAWSRAGISTFSRLQQPPPLPSDRSASLATASIGSRVSFSSKELRERFRPVSNEEKMEQRLGELDSLLARDYAKEARLAYQRSVAECRQSWQNYVSTARIMGDQQPQPQQHQEQHHQRQFFIPPAVEAQEAATEGDSRHHPLGSRVAPPASEEPPQEPRPDLRGYRVGAPLPRAGKFGSDHRLSESANPDVRAWLREKNRESRRQRREARDAKRREVQEKIDAQQRRSDRKLEAEASFHTWVRRKKQAEEQQTVDGKKNQDSSGSGGDKNGGRRQAPVENPSELPLADQEEALASLEALQRQQRPPGPRPVHNSVFKRGSSALGVSGASFSGRQVRMGILGRSIEVPAAAQQHQQQLAIEQPQQPPENRQSFDDWLQQKAAQRDAERKKSARTAAAPAPDPEVAALVPQLARRRIRIATELRQRRTDTGLGLTRRPRTAVAALNPPPQQQQQQQRRASSRQRRTNSMERREADITSELPNPFVQPAGAIDAQLFRRLE